MLQAGRLDLAEDAEEQIDVAVDQVEPALVRLAAQAGGDADEVARRGSPRSRRRGCAGRPRARRRAAGRAPGPRQRSALTSIRSISLTIAAALQGERRARADQSAAADDADFHGVLSRLSRSVRMSVHRQSARRLRRRPRCPMRSPGRRPRSSCPCRRPTLFIACITWSVIVWTSASRSDPPAPGRSGGLLRRASARRSASGAWRG